MKPMRSRWAPSTPSAPTSRRPTSTTVNTVGQPLYAKQEPRKFDRGTDLHAVQPAADVPSPGALVKLTAA